MKKQLNAGLAVILLALALLTCSSVPTLPSATDVPGMVETMVAATLSSLLGTPEEGLPPATEVPASTLPRSLYYQAPDSGGVIQVYRLERDGMTLSQVTHEVADVSDYSVAGDGRLAYVANNQLLLENADGSGRQVLVDGGLLDENNPYIDRVSAPVWSPDDSVIAFGYGGLNFYQVAAFGYSTALTDVIEDNGMFKMPRELFFPAEYSPDGRYLLMNIGWYEGGTYGIYDTAMNTRIAPAMQGILCCAETWSPDSTAVYFASSSMGMIDSGMWRFDRSGSVTTLLPGSAADGTFNFADYPFIAPDGQLYYFFGNYGEIPSGHTPLMLVRSATDGVSGRSLVLPETFTSLNEALWAPDGSLVITAEATSDTMWYGGRLTARYLDGRLPVTLAEFGTGMRWGP